ncbi:MAG: flagellar brake protein [Planctomycetota bacterium]
MPANRSRTLRWRDCLQQVLERNGGLELSVARPDGDDAEPGSDLLWRVRLIDLRDDAIIVDRPSLAGGAMKFGVGAEVVVVMAIGQNRWMFKTEIVGEENAGRALVLRMPEHVERCTRRNFLRVSTAEVSLPRVECWPLLDPTTVIPAERANKVQVMTGKPAEDDRLILPEVGPKFTAQLMNVSGGGLGLLVPPEGASALDRSRLLWIRVALQPTIPEPIGMTARVAHTHMDSAQNRYAGCAFEFAFHPEHRDFIVSQLSAYVTRLIDGGSRDAG